MKSVPFRELKKKTSDKILVEVRNKKIAELSHYKNKSPDRRHQDITSLLHMMSEQGMKVPKMKQGKVEGHGGQ